VQQVFKLFITYVKLKHNHDKTISHSASLHDKQPTLEAQIKTTNENNANTLF